MKGKNESDRSVGSEDALPAKVLRTVVGGNRPEEPKNIDGDVAAAMTAGTSETGAHITFWQSFIQPEVPPSMVEVVPTGMPSPRMTEHFPTSGSPHPAAADWDELSALAAGDDSTIKQLVNEEWAGPSATDMAKAVSPYQTWLSDAADMAKKVAEPAQTAAAAYEEARSATVGWATVQQNKEMLAKMVSENVIGTNSHHIKEAEDRLSEMFNMPLPIEYLGGGDQESSQASHDAALSHQAKHDDAPASHQENAGKKAPDITASRRR